MRTAIFTVLIFAASSFFREANASDSARFGVLNPSSYSSLEKEFTKKWGAPQKNITEVTFFDVPFETSKENGFLLHKNGIRVKLRVTRVLEHVTEAVLEVRLRNPDTETRKKKQEIVAKCEFKINRPSVSTLVSDISQSKTHFMKLASMNVGKDICIKRDGSLLHPIGVLVQRSQEGFEVAADSTHGSFDMSLMAIVGKYVARGSIWDSKVEGKKTLRRRLMKVSYPQGFQGAYLYWNKKEALPLGHEFSAPIKPRLSKMALRMARKQRCSKKLREWESKSWVFHPDDGIVCQAD